MTRCRACLRGFAPDPDDVYECDWCARATCPRCLVPKWHACPECADDLDKGEARERWLAARDEYYERRGDELREGGRLR